LKNLIIIGLSILLGACTHGPFAPKTLEPTMAKDSMQHGHYELSDNYANHRLQQKKISTSGGMIHFIDAGDGPVLLMIHGVPTSSWLYRKMIDELQSDFRVIAIDLLGYGSSDKPDANDGNYSALKQADYVHQVLEALDIADYNLLFHDMGGLVAWELVRQDLEGEENVKSLNILNTIISKQGFDYPKMEKGVVAKMMSEAYSSNLSSAAVLKMTFKNMGLSSDYRLSENECFGYVAPMREGSDAALYQFFTGFDDRRFARLESNIAALEKFGGRTQILWGAKDKVLSVDQFPQLTRSLKVRAEDITVYANNAHFLPEEIPSALSMKVREFLLTEPAAKP